MKQLNPEWVNFVKSFVNASPYFKNQNMRLADLKYGEVGVDIELERKHLQGYAYLPGVEEIKTQIVLDKIKEDPSVIIPE